MSFMKAIADCQYIMTAHMTDGSNSNTVPLTVQFRTLDTADSTYIVQTDGVPRDLSVLTVMVGIQVLSDVTLSLHFIRLLKTEDEATGSLQTRHIT